MVEAVVIEMTDMSKAYDYAHEISMSDDRFKACAGRCIKEVILPTFDWLDREQQRGEDVINVFCALLQNFGGVLASNIVAMSNGRAELLEELSEKAINQLGDIMRKSVSIAKEHLDSKKKQEN